MIARPLKELRRFPAVALLFLLLAAVCVALAIIQHLPNWGIFGVLPAFLGTALLIARPSEFHGEVNDQGLLIHTTGESIAYHEIHRLWHSPTHSPSEMFVLHRGGTLRIPDCIGIRAAQLHAFLHELLPRQDVTGVHPAITPYLRAQTGTFGAEKVWAHNARGNVLPAGRQLERAVYVSIWLTVGVWIIAGVARSEPAWGGGAMLLGLMTALIWILRRSSTAVGAGIKRWQESSLVIGPAGLALAQGDLKGELRWAELRHVRFKDSSSQRRRRIELRVEGAQINVVDIYDSPLSEIHQQIVQYWESG